MPELNKRIPKEYKRYFEPFFGAGALYFDIEPAKAYINDFNHSLINLYCCCRDDRNTLKQYLLDLQNGFNNSKDKSEYYYLKRERYNELLNKDSYEEAALFVFLNRTGFNGLYRVNSSGLFNVPFGQKIKVDLMTDRVDKASDLLSKCEISEGDFEQICKKARKGDFVYFDPPYYETFVGYQANGFGEDDQRRLNLLFRKLSEKGVYCMLSNSDTEFIKELYKDFHIDVIPVKRLINRNPLHRTANEVIVTNYEVNYDK